MLVFPCDGSYDIYFQTYSYCDILFDNEAQGSGVFLPELDDPEHCNAHNTTLWELSYLQVSLTATDHRTKLTKSSLPECQRYERHLPKLGMVIL